MSEMDQASTTKQRLYADVLRFTSVKPARNHKHTESLNQVADYIMEVFKKTARHTEFQTFKADGKEYKNVIATFGPEKGSRIVVGAHYDVCEDQPGADDNASSVAGLLELARMLHNNKATLSHRIDLVAYCLEEPPYFATKQMGSAIHARYLHENKIPVKAMICLEMIGYFSDKPGSQNFPDANLAKLYPSTGNFILVVGNRDQEKFTAQVKDLMKTYSDIGVESINLPVESPVAGLSDHRNYWQYGMNAVMINDTSFLRNPNYHRKTDTIDTLDFDKMVEVIKGVYGVVFSLATN